MSVLNPQADRSVLAPALGPSRTLRIALAVVAPLAPLAILVGRYLTSTVTDNAEALTFAATNPDILSLGPLITLVIAITLVPGVLAAGLAALDGSPRAATAGLLIGIPAWAAALGMPDTMGVAGALLRADVPTDAAVRTLDQLEQAGPALDVTFGLFVIGHIVATVILGIALYRSRAIPRAIAVGLAISQPLHFVAFVVLQSALLDAIAYGLTAIGFGAAGIALARRR